MYSHMYSHIYSHIDTSCCRAKSARIRQSRPDYGLGLNHFAGALRDLTVCAALASPPSRAGPPLSEPSQN